MNIRDQTFNGETVNKTNWLLTLATLAILALLLEQLVNRLLVPRRIQKASAGFGGYGGI